MTKTKLPRGGHTSEGDPCSASFLPLRVATKHFKPPLGAVKARCLKLSPRTEQPASVAGVLFGGPLRWAEEETAGQRGRGPLRGASSLGRRRRERERERERAPGEDLGENPGRFHVAHSCTLMHTCSSDSKDKASFWLCDLGLAVDSQSWTGEEKEACGGGEALKPCLSLLSRVSKASKFCFEGEPLASDRHRFGAFWTALSLWHQRLLCSSSAGFQAEIADTGRPPAGWSTAPCHNSHR